MEIQKEKVMKYDFAAIEKKWQDKWEHLSVILPTSRWVISLCLLV